MRPGRIRFSVRGLMLAGAVVAVLLGGVAIPAWRHVEYGRKAALHAQAAERCRRLGDFVARNTSMPEPLGPTEAQKQDFEAFHAARASQVTWYLQLAERHEVLAARYAAAAARPWRAPPPE